MDGALIWAPGDSVSVRASTVVELIRHEKIANSCSKCFFSMPMKNAMFILALIAVHVVVESWLTLSVLSDGVTVDGCPYLFLAWVPQVCGLP